MNKEIKIRFLKEEDFNTVVALDELTLYRTWTLAQYQREFSLPNSRFWLLCLTNDHRTTEKVIGMGCWRKISSDVEIPIFAIYPDYQAQGLGKYFFSWLLSDIVNHNLRYARLEVRTSNQRAIALYQKFGFQIITRLSNYYHLDGEDGYKMMSSSLQNDSFKQRLDFWLRKFSDNLEQKNFILPLNPNQIKL